jgi:hypothetical protein
MLLREIIAVYCEWAEREKESGGCSERHYIGVGGGVRNYISDFEGSQAVPACPSGIDRAYNRIFLYNVTCLESRRDTSTETLKTVA